MNSVGTAGADAASTEMEFFDGVKSKVVCHIVHTNRHFSSDNSAMNE